MESTQLKWVAFLFLLGLTSSCSHYSEKNPEDPSTIVPATVSWRKVSSDVFDRRCSICHGQGGAGINTTDYNSTVSDISRVEEVVLKRKSMPPDSELTAYETALLNDWIQNGTPLTLPGDGS